MRLRRGRAPPHDAGTVRPTGGETRPFQSALSGDALQGGVVSGLPLPHADREFEPLAERLRLKAVPV